MAALVRVLSRAPYRKDIPPISTLERRPGRRLLGIRISRAARIRGGARRRRGGIERSEVIDVDVHHTADVCFDYGRRTAPTALQ